jgi:glycosyltransferase involved in cell wall biosynthesis
LIWSGIAKKSQQLLMLRDVFAKLPDVELVLVSDDHPTAMEELQEVIPCEYVRYSDRSYTRALLGCDVIISPKILNNAYEMGHTEYKITLGMAVGLPSVASAQRSYVEAIEHRGGGIIAETEADWLSALSSLASDAEMRRDLGEKARLTVLEKYSTPVVAQSFLNLLKG